MKKKIKILQLIESMDDGGAQRIILNYLNDFHSDNDIEIKVLVYSDRTNSFCNRLIKKYDYNVDYLFENIHNKYIKKGIKLLFGKLMLTNYIRKYKPDIVHVHISTFLAICLKPIVKCNVPIRFDTLHSNPYRFSGKKLNYIKQAFNQEGFVGICLTNVQLDRAIKHYGMKNYELVRNGIDINNIKNNIIPKKDARKKFGLRQNSFVIGAVGRLNAIKRYDLLLKIFKEIVAIKENAFLIIAGDGPEKEKLIELARQLDISDKVAFLGNIDNVTDVYCAIDVFVMTSESEASPLVLIESQICGTRCVISDGVPSESIVTNIVKKMHRDDSIDEWCRAILDTEYVGNIELDIINYDVHKSCEEMKKIYIKYWKEYVKNENL